MSRINAQGLLLNNNEFLQAKASGGAATNLLKLNASNLPEFALEVVGVDPTVSTHLATKNYIDVNFVLQSALGVSVATLVSGKVPSSQLPASVVGALNYKGTYDASTAVYPSSPAKGDYYVISVAGTISSHAYAVGDWITYDGTQWDYIDNSQKVSSVFGRLGAVVAVSGDYNTSQVTESGNLYYTQARFDSAFGAKTTDNLAEGTTNLYFTSARAQAAAVVNSLAGSQTAQAPSVASVNTALALKQASFTSIVEEFTLTATDITNGYKDLGHVSQSAAAVKVYAFGGVFQSPVTDFSVGLTTGVGGVTRVTFAGDLSSGLVSGNKIDVEYRY